MKKDEWKWIEDDLSEEVKRDPGEALFSAPFFDRSGKSGALVRQFTEEVSSNPETKHKEGTV